MKENLIIISVLLLSLVLTLATGAVLLFGCIWLANTLPAPFSGLFGFACGVPIGAFTVIQLLNLPDGIWCTAICAVMDRLGLEV